VRKARWTSFWQADNAASIDHNEGVDDLVRQIRAMHRIGQAMEAENLCSINAGTPNRGPANHFLQQFLARVDQ
jgi:hypothetical protein